MSLNQRLKYFCYMRSSLFKLLSSRGTLFQPLFTIDSMAGFGPKGFDGLIEPSDVSSVLWGSAIKADLQFDEKDTKIVKFPAGTRWIDLSTMEPIIAQPD